MKNIHLATKALSAALVMASAGCASKRDTTESSYISPLPHGTSAPVQVLPRAKVYRTNGDFSQNVPVTLTPDRKSLVSFPAPTDLAEGRLPVALSEGYLLDRRGINANTAFLKYTYAQYMALEQVPSPERLLDDIIPGAIVTEIITLPMTVTAAEENIGAVNALVGNGFPGCETILSRHAILLTPQ